MKRTDATLGASLQRVLSSLAVNRCFACGWPLTGGESGCKPFDCSMRWKDGSEHMAEREGWHKRAEEMAEVFRCFTSASSPFVVSETAAPAHKPRGAYVPLTEEEVECIRVALLNWYGRSHDADIPDRLCDMAINSLLFSKEIDRLRSAPSATRLRPEDAK